MTKNFLLYSLVVMLFCSCGENETEVRKDGFSKMASTPEDSLFQEVMDGHDEAMAKMGKLAGYRKTVDRKIDSLKKVRTPAKQKLNKEYADLKTQLKDAEEHMNVWMEQFSIDSAQDDLEKRLQYLSNEKIKVERVKEEIFGVLKRADSLFAIHD